MNYLIVVIATVVIYLKAPGLAVAILSALTLWSSRHLTQAMIRRADLNLMTKEDEQ